MMEEVREEADRLMVKEGRLNRGKSSFQKEREDPCLAFTEENRIYVEGETCVFYIIPPIPIIKRFWSNFQPLVMNNDHHRHLSSIHFLSSETLPSFSTFFDNQPCAFGIFSGGLSPFLS